MDNAPKTFKVDRHKQLVPLNPGLETNFVCSFEIKSLDGKPFQTTIVEQGQIKPTQYREVDDGFISGQLEGDGTPRSYFLVLRAQEPCECTVKIVLSPKQQVQPHQQTHQQSQQTHNKTVANSGDPPPPPPSQPNKFLKPKWIVGMVIGVVVLYLLYRYRAQLMDKLNLGSKTPFSKN
ncbi:hypothetical protein MIV073R [Invertebrate iridescent virus 3]|uniref:Uncharacterized protein 073R n=1 Tax=Invertebrate iridescent virus 3 TaxID=345201 RepID=073R_IIV3|nr:hypothetical protein MIV073R [Invertebrate iridescent virus 3]Q196Y7.1 RecName: Full=Uncharacterized protein 073R [Invertebrate iridescent virus 3]ABF82103.1 hypothetical protein MIV073R [Invertebrate iridescent virus 3]